MHFDALEAPDVYEKKKEKKVGWFTRWFDRKCRDSWDRARNEIQHSQSPPMSTIDGEGLNLTIFGADGGTILQFRHYNHKLDRSSHTLHVISQDENFEERVAHAITMELLRNGIHK